MAFHLQTRRGWRGEDGYILLTLLLAMALIIIFAAAIVPTIKFQIERDREEEMIHRGVQYARAIRCYYKKFSRYPTKIEDLENTNNLRFLRKRYKDPTNCSQGKCQDFKLLHFGEVKLTFSGGIGGGAIAGASPIGSPGDQSGAGGLGQTSAFGGNSGLGQSSGFGGNSGFGQSSGLGGNSGFGQSSGLGGSSSFGNSSSGFGGNQPSANSASGSDSSQPSSQDTGAAGSNPAASSGDTSGGTSPNSGDKLSGQVFGGGPIVGVASLTKKTGYREFNHKKKYSEWQFIYDPGTDRGGLLMTPYQPQLQGFAQQGTQNLNGQNAGNNPSGSGGFGSTFSGTQNNPNSPSSGGFGGSGTLSQPNNPPEQQQ
ncbi:conserved exported hypothetical protein [Candidatus Sulfotelmatobacter kueseliae]|uniref:Type II secretion system protein n=1 Tax=Candidatus Sulfotelmatobacter kueseliae TaxID=2042962 RepID=A0A2U3KH54_9BACT|nr:conserved exported hypothetical protein [Candidatus Sulfotelmatobacter kueseliae]